MPANYTRLYTPTASPALRLSLLIITLTSSAGSPQLPNISRLLFLDISAMEARQPRTKSTSPASPSRPSVPSVTRGYQPPSGLQSSSTDEPRGGCVTAAQLARRALVCNLRLHTHLSPSRPLPRGQHRLHLITYRRARKGALAHVNCCVCQSAREPLADERARRNKHYDIGKYARQAALGVFSLSCSQS